MSRPNGAIDNADSGCLINVVVSSRPLLRTQKSEESNMSKRKRPVCGSVSWSVNGSMSQLVRHSYFGEQGMNTTKQTPKDFTRWITYLTFAGGLGSVTFSLT